MAAPFTLQQLLQAQGLDAVESQFLALLQAGGFPAITEWAGEPTGTEMTFVKMVCRALNQLAGSAAPEDQRIASVAAGRFLAWAKGGWLDLLGENFYLQTRDAPTRTTFQMTLLSVPGSPDYQFQVNGGVGDIWLVGPTGKRYNSTTPGTLEPGGEVQIAFQAEDVGSAWSDDPSIVTLQLVTGFAGVSLSPTAGDFSIVTTSGSSTGRVQPERSDPDVKPLPHRYGIQIVEDGDPGVATWAVQVDDGPFISQGILQPTNVLADGASFQAVAGAAAPSFIAGDVFVFSTPGTPNYVQGDDEETDPAYAARCSYRWPAQSLNVMDGKVKLWVQKAYPAANRIQVTPDFVTPGRFIVTIADSHGSVDQTALDAVEAYVKPRLNQGEGMGARTPADLFVFARGSVKVPRTISALDLEEVQAAADEAWRKYVSSVDIGPSDVKLSFLNDVLIDAGAIDCSGLVLNAGGVDWPINVEVDSGLVAVVGDLLTRTLTWGFE